jgi:hypothetical protein
LYELANSVWMLFFSSLGTGATSTNACAVSLFALSLNRNCGVGDLKPPSSYGQHLHSLSLPPSCRYTSVSSLLGYCLVQVHEWKIKSALQGKPVRAMFTAQNIKLA